MTSCLPLSALALALQKPLNPLAPQHACTAVVSLRIHHWLQLQQAPGQPPQNIRDKPLPPQAVTAVHQCCASSRCPDLCQQAGLELLKLLACDEPPVTQVRRLTQPRQPALSGGGQHSDLQAGCNSRGVQGWDNLCMPTALFSAINTTTQCAEPAHLTRKQLTCARVLQLSRMWTR